MDDGTTIRDNLSLIRFRLLGAILGGVGYGVSSILCSICLFLLVRLRKKHARLRSRDIFLFGFCIAVWMSITVTFVSDTVILWQFLLDPVANLESTCGSIGYPGLWGTNINNWLIDGLLVWRAIIILKSHGSRYMLLSVIPILLLLGSMGTAIYMLTIGSFPKFFVLLALYITIALNVSVTAIISVCLYIQHRRFLAVFPHKKTSQITNVISMLVESAVLIVAFDIFFVIPFAQAQEFSNDFSNLPLQMLAYAQATGTFLTIFRVAQGKAWVNYEGHRNSSAVLDPSRSTESI